MNPSNNPQQPSQEELHPNGPNEQRTATQWSMDTQGDSGIERLPNEVMLSIFRFLNVDQLLIAEQVCLGWKAIVNTVFATTTTVRILHLRDFEKLRRYGPSLKSLTLEFCDDDEARTDWINEIGNAFPNLQSLVLNDVPVRSESLRDLPVKCSQINEISFRKCYLSDEDVAIVLKGFPGLKYLGLSRCDDLNKCFRHLGSNIERLFLACVEVSPAGTRHIFSRCKNLQEFKFEFGFECDARSFSKFCEKTPLRKLSINRIELPKEVFLPISRLSLLDTLILIECPEVDSDVLIKISLGCTNLKYLDLTGPLPVCDRGVKAFAQCRHLTTFYCSRIDTVTDESLFEFATAGILERLVITKCSISDRGVSAILAQCPILHLQVDEDV